MTQPDKLRSKATYRDPASTALQWEVGLTQRQIVLECKRRKWPWRRVYGRAWVCSDFTDRLLEARHNEREN
jgi:hypothetical protein